MQVRQVVCTRIEDLQLVKLDDGDCDPAAKMVNSQNCTGQECGGLWFTGPWGKVMNNSHINLF